MRIAELSQTSGVSTANIKFYTREGLLPPGDRLGYNHTEYHESHVERLKLIVALTQVGGLSIASARDVLQALDSRSSVDQVLGAAYQTVIETDASEDSMGKITALCEHMGWTIWPGHPGVRMAAHAVDSFQLINAHGDTRMLVGYAMLADKLGSLDLEYTLRAAGEAPTMGEAVVVGSIVGDRLLSGLRRIAQINTLIARLGAETVRTTWAEDVFDAYRQAGDTPSA